MTFIKQSRGKKIFTVGIFTFMDINFDVNMKNVSLSFLSKPVDVTKGPQSNILDCTS